MVFNHTQRYNKLQYEKVINTSFTQLGVQPINEQIENQPTVNDFSPMPYYFNYFTISIATPEGLTAGVIDIPSGQYQYYVYEIIYFFKR